MYRPSDSFCTFFSESRLAGNTISSIFDKQAVAFLDLKNTVYVGPLLLFFFSLWFLYSACFILVPPLIFGKSCVQQYAGSTGSKIVLCLCGTFGNTSQVLVSQNTGSFMLPIAWTEIWHQHPILLCVRPRHCIVCVMSAVLRHCNLTKLL